VTLRCFPPITHAIAAAARANAPVARTNTPQAFAIAPAARAIGPMVTAVLPLDRPVLLNNTGIAAPALKSQRSATTAPAQRTLTPLAWSSSQPEAGTETKNTPPASARGVCAI